MIRRAGAAGAASAIADLRRNRDLALPADLHPSDAHVESLDDLAGAKTEAKSLPTVDAAVEDLPIGKRPGVVDLHRVARLGFRPLAYRGGFARYQSVLFCPSRS